MKTHKLIQTLSHGIKSILVRNLCNPSTVQFSPPSPCIEIYGAVRQQDSTTCDTHRIFKGGTLPLCCNPSWPGLDFKSDIFKDHQDINELHFRIYDDVENNSEEGGKVLIHQCEWDIKKLVRIGGHISLSNIPALPHNAILLALEDGGLLVDERLYLTLRANGFISVTNKYNSDEGSEETDEYAQRDEAMRGELLETIAAATMSIQEHQKTSERLIQSRGAIALSRHRSLRLMELDKLRVEVSLAENEVELERLAERNDIAQLEDTAAEMKAAREQCVALREAVGVIEKDLERRREELLRTKFILEARQMKLFTELVGSIYPIETASGGGTREVAGEGDGRTGIDDDYTIRGIELPMVIDTSLKDDEQISSALGYVVHILVLASKYLQIPLRYEVIYCSSRSMIRDAVVGSGRPLPLFKRGVERERFDRALMWLQKDVEQLMLLRGYNYDRKRSILANLKNLFACELCPTLVS